MEIALYRIIANGDTDKALSFLERPSVTDRINNYAYGFHTCLFKACSRGYKDVVTKILLIPTVDIQCGDSLGNTPLHAATENNKLDIVKLLVESGSKCKENYLNKIPLHIAAYKDYTQILQLLLDNFSESINSKCSDFGIPFNGPIKFHIHGSPLHIVSMKRYHDVTPLHVSSLNGSLNSVKLLVRYGADSTLNTREGKTAYDFAVEKGHKDVASYLNNIRKDNACCNPDLITHVANLEIKCNKVETQCNQLKAENEDLKSKMSKMEKYLGNSKKNKHCNEGKSPMDCIRHNFEFLIENMFALDHLDYLYQEEALSRDDYQVIRDTKGDNDKTREMLIRLLGKKNTDWVEVFRKSLETKAEHLLVIFN